MLHGTSADRFRYAALGLVAATYVASFFPLALSIPIINRRLVDRLNAEFEARVGLGPLWIPAESIQGPKTFDLRGYDCFRESMQFGSNGLSIAAWSANPVLWIGVGLLAVGKFKPAGFCGLLSAGLALVALPLPYIGRENAEIYWSVSDYRLGYWIWLASAVALALLGLTGWRTSQSSVEPSQVESNGT